MIKLKVPVSEIGFNGLMRSAGATSTDWSSLQVATKFYALKTRHTMCFLLQSLAKDAHWGLVCIPAIIGGITLGYFFPLRLEAYASSHVIKQCEAKVTAIPFILFSPSHRAQMNFISNWQLLIKGEFSGHYKIKMYLCSRYINNNYLNRTFSHCNSLITKSLKYCKNLFSLSLVCQAITMLLNCCN